MYSIVYIKGKGYAVVSNEGVLVAGFFSTLMEAREVLVELKG